MISKLPVLATDPRARSIFRPLRPRPLGSLACLAMLLALFSVPALAGPPYLTDDPEPTDTGHYEIYFFSEGATAADGRDGSVGIDFNYGAAEDLQLSAVLPINWISPTGQGGSTGLGNVELGVKYKFSHQQDVGIDAAFYPTILLPAGSAAVGEQHAALLLPLWLQRTSGAWTVFGGGACELTHGGDSRNFCMFGTALTRDVGEKLQIGAEVFHQTADTRDGRASTFATFGASYDINDNFHLAASIGPGLQHRSETDRTVWYAALLWTR